MRNILERSTAGVAGGQVGERKRTKRSVQNRKELSGTKEAVVYLKYR